MPQAIKHISLSKLNVIRTLLTHPIYSLKKTGNVWWWVDEWGNELDPAPTRACNALADERLITCSAHNLYSGSELFEYRPNEVSRRDTGIYFDGLPVR